MIGGDAYGNPSHGDLVTAGRNPATGIPSDLSSDPADPSVTVEPVDFYMVWNKAGRPPKVCHSTRPKAEKEARRLAAKSPGRKFIVLQAVSKFGVPVVAEDRPTSLAEIQGDPYGEDGRPL